MSARFWGDFASFITEADGRNEDTRIKAPLLSTEHLSVYTYASQVGESEKTGKKRDEMRNLAL
ncbi:hypothetical protein N7513_003232 [Penicillium frequentans]|uniref:Uncharacterized protein n=1 Tax=Penicillium frequentans TaxID=3151616 RepID=A0AAD6G9I6_9EURO|nr:hypothetical protein N7494_013225 [Penicillium glabrum]KAJ5557646.1 hypothetical protein N7513_003232 [Penicillium glabrum]